MYLRNKCVSCHRTLKEGQKPPKGWGTLQLRERDTEDNWKALVCDKCYKQLKKIFIYSPTYIHTYLACQIDPRERNDKEYNKI